MLTGGFLAIPLALCAQFLAAPLARFAQPFPDTWQLVIIYGNRCAVDCSEHDQSLFHLLVSKSFSWTQ